VLDLPAAATPRAAIHRGIHGSYSTSGVPDTTVVATVHHTNRLPARRWQASPDDSRL